MSNAPAKKKDIKVHVRRCGHGDCRALLPLEETDEGLLLGNMFALATRDGDEAYFPCPACGGRNLVEEVVYEGRRRTRVSGYRAA